MRKGNTKMYREGAKRFLNMGRLLKDSRFVQDKGRKTSPKQKGKR